MRKTAGNAPGHRREVAADLLGEGYYNTSITTSCRDRLRREDFTPLRQQEALWNAAYERGRDLERGRFQGAEGFRPAGQDREDDRERPARLLLRGGVRGGCFSSTASSNSRANPAMSGRIAGIRAVRAFWRPGWKRRNPGGKLKPGVKSRRSPLHPHSINGAAACTSPHGTTGSPGRANARSTPTSSRLVMKGGKRWPTSSTKSGTGIGYVP